MRERKYHTKPAGCRRAVPARPQVRLDEAGEAMTSRYIIVSAMSGTASICSLCLGGGVVTCYWCHREIGQALAVLVSDPSTTSGNVWVFECFECRQRREAREVRE